MLQAGPVLHSWIPAFDAELAKQSPGLVLMRAVLLEAPARGITLFDLGKGDESYKLSVANDTIEVGTGSVQSTAPWRAVAAAAQASLEAVNRTRLQGRAYRAERRLQVG